MIPSVRARYTGLGLLVAAFAFAADQASKWWVTGPLGLRPFDASVPVLPLASGPPGHPDGLYLTLVDNSGITFGLLHGGAGVGQILLIVLAVAVVIGLFVWLRRAESRLIAVALGAIAGGALGNVCDRLRAGYVTDFIDARLFGYNWYVFNVADALIVCGVAALVLDGLWPRRGGAAIAADPLRDAGAGGNDPAS